MKYWGKYDDDNHPKVHFDPLQAFIENDRSVGFRVHVVPGRDRRPRDFNPPSSNQSPDLDPPEESVLYRIAMGKEPAVPVATEDTPIGLPTDNAIKRNWMENDSLAVMNKFAPLDVYRKEAGGAALVIFPTTYEEELVNHEVNTDILKCMSTSIDHLLVNKNYRDDLRTPLSFFNIGPSSGASLKILHGQTYLTTHAAGLLTYTFNRAFRANINCLCCQIANNSEVNDHLSQTINYDKLTIWEDQNCRLIVPYAPLRPLSLRIIVKPHHNHIGKINVSTLNSLGKALQIGHEAIIKASFPGWPIKRDRTIAFRQTEDLEKDFHTFVDIMPSIPLGGAEVIDSLMVTSIDPYRFADRIRKVI